jgi:hypothetical protein
MKSGKTDYSLLVGALCPYKVSIHRERESDFLVQESDLMAVRLGQLHQQLGAHF